MSSACLIVGVVLGVVIWARTDSIIQRVLLVGVLVVLVAIVGRDVGRVRRGEVLFAVHRGGVYFGSDPVIDDVPWATICAVELYAERGPSGRSSSVHHCIGVRTPGKNPLQRPGNTPGALPLLRVSARYFEDAGRTDLLPGADGTIRWATRRMSGWRVDRVRLSAAVRHYAPAIPVIDGPDWPPALSEQEGIRARRVQRRAGR